MRNIILITFLLIFIILLPVFSQDTKVKETLFNGYITGDNVIIRESYSINSKVLGFLKIGTAIKCELKTITKDRIGTDLYYWFKCSPRAFGTTGWIYGKYVSKDFFDSAKYIQTLNPIESNSKLYNKLINTKWSTCDGNLPIECYATFFKSNTIETYGMEGNFIYQIKSIIENENTITLTAMLILSNISISGNPNKVVQFRISNITNGTLYINNGIRYKI